MNVFLKSFSKTSIGSISSMAFGAVVIKIIATFSGPQGVGVFSILKDLSQTLALAFSLSGNTAIVKNLSTNDNKNKELFIHNIVKIIIINTTFMCLIYFFFIKYIYTHLLGNLDAISIYTLLIVLISGIAGSLNIICNSILNANRKLGWMAISQIIATLIGAIITYPFISLIPTMYSFALILVIINVTWLIVNLFILHKQEIKINWLKSVFTKIETQSVYQFSSLAGATFITSMAGMATMLTTRLFIEKKLGIETLGIFDAAWTLGAVYIMFLLTSFGTYVLPVLSSMHARKKRDEFLGNIIIVTSSIFTLLVITMLTFSEYLILLFYSEKFLTSSEMLKYLLLGDFFKVIGYTYGIFFLSHNRPWTFVFISLSWNIIFLSILYLGIDQYGILIAPYASIAAHMIYLIMVLVICRTNSLTNISPRVLVWLFPMFAIIISTSFIPDGYSIYIYPFSMVVGLLIAYYLLFKKNLFLG